MGITHQGHVQEHMQATILLLIAQTGQVEPNAVFAQCPRTDRRDISRAIEVLVSQGCLEAQPAGEPGAWPRITDGGRRRLAASYSVLEHASAPPSGDGRVRGDRVRTRLV